MMTRETKAGLVVSCSFLCLVGIVLVSKMREAHNPDTAGDPGAAALAQAVEEPKPAPEQQSGPSAAQKGKPIEAQKDLKQPVDKGVLAQSKNKSPENKVIPAAFNGEGLATNLNSAGTSQNQSQQKAAPTLTAPSFRKDKESSAVAIDDAAPVMDAGLDNKTNSSIFGQTPVPSIAVAQPTAKDKKASILNWVPDTEKKKATSLQGMGLRKPGDTATFAGQTQPALNAVADVATTSIGGAKRSVVLPPLEQLTTPNLDSKGQTDKAGAPTIIGIRPAAPTLDVNAVAGGVAAAPVLGPGNGSRTGLGAAIPAPADTATTPASANTQADSALSLQHNDRGQDSPTLRGVRLDAPVLGAASANAGGQTVSPRTPAFDDASSRPRTPFGAPIAAVSAPIVAAPAPTLTGSTSAPQVESYDEDTFTCKGTESFRSISQAVYQADGYDQALLLFNRNHPLANDAVKQNPPLLQPGQPIYIPPLRILRKYYAASIVETAGTNPARGTATGETASGVNLAAPASLPPTPTATRPYRVGANAEMIRDIARRTLGNPDRWTEIYQLNRTFDPTYPVPASTELKLPADARLDAQ